MNVIKMRKNTARQMPDVAWRSFHLDCETAEDYEAWRLHFQKQMQIKHGAKFFYAEAYKTECFDGLYSRMQLRAVLAD